MCRWHKEAIKRVATNPENGKFNVGSYVVGLVAMGLLRVEQTKWNLSALFEVDGFNPQELLEDRLQQAFNSAALGPKRSLQEVNARLNDFASQMRGIMEGIAQHTDISAAALHITDNITADGYKKTCCAPADPRQNGPFLDTAIVYLCKGYDDEATRDYARGPLRLISAQELSALAADPAISAPERARLAQMEPLRAAASLLLAQPAMIAALEAAFADSVRYIFMSAADDVAEGRGLSGPSDCIMCEGVKGRKPS